MLPAAGVAANPGVLVARPRSDSGPLVRGSLSPSTTSVPSAWNAYCTSPPQRSSFCEPPSMSTMIADEELCWASSTGQPLAAGGLVEPEITADGAEALYEES